MNSLIIPVFKNEAFIPQLMEVCEWLNARLNYSLEVVFVVDGSPDRSAALLEQRLPEASFNFQLVELSKNFGSFAAIKRGLEVASGDYFSVMAADLQEPKELVLEFFKELHSQECDVVIGSRESRQDPLMSRAASQSFWWLYRKMIEPNIPPGGADVFGCNRPFRDQLIQLKEANSSLVGLIFWMGYRRKLISYVRKEREIGKSGWTLSKKIRYMLDNVFSFTDLPVQMLVGCGAMGLLFSVGLASLILISKVSGTISVPGYAATALLILFFASLNSMGLGIIGVYVWRAFENTKQRPEAMVMRRTRSEQWKKNIYTPKQSASL